MRTGWWNWEGWPLPDEWAAFWAFCTFLVAAGAAVVALVEFAAYRQEQADRSRPYLFVDFDFTATFVYVKVENISPTPATRVTLRGDPLLRSTRADQDKVIQRLLAGSIEIPQVAPGQKIRWLIDVSSDLYSASLPHRTVVTATYFDPRAKVKASRFQESFLLDLDQYGDASAEQDYVNKNWNIAKRNEGVFKEIRNSLSRAAGALEDLSAVPSKKALMKGRRRPRRR